MSATALRKGHRRYLAQHRKQARARVRAWQCWNRQHGPLSQMPPIPSSRELKLYGEGR
jgi:hypothetical protein